MVDKHFFTLFIREVALLGIPEMCTNMIGDVASLYVYDLFHGGFEV